MPFVPLVSTSPPALAQQVSLQIGSVRDLVRNGRAETARQMCSAVFLEHALLLSRDEALLGAYVQCLLLLEMTALLPRVLQAIHGTTVDMVPEPGAEGWRVSFGNGRAVVVAPADRSARTKAGEGASAALLEAAGCEPAEVKRGALIAA